MRDTLKNLEMLTEKLPPLEYLTARKGTEWVEYKVENGYCLGIGLYKNDEGAIQRSIITKGTIFPRHRHLDAVEFLIVSHGSILIHEDGKEDRVVGVGDSHRFEIGVAHSMEALDDVRLFGITVPAGEGYPNVA